MKQGKKKIGLILLALGLLALAYSLIQLADRQQPTAFIAPAKEYRLYDDKISALDHFVTRYFLSQGLVQTNLMTTVQGELASGEDMLSESVGLMLQYYVKTNQPEAFEAHLKLANDVLLKQNGLYQWRYRKGQSEAVSAAVDDLRIIKALRLASSKWDTQTYEKEVRELSLALLKNCTKDGLLLSDDQPNAQPAPLFYYDLPTLKDLALTDSRWLPIYSRAEQMLREQKHDQLPFFKDSIGPDQTYRMIENLLVLLYLSEVEELNQSDLTWYKKQLTKGAVYSHYTATGSAASSVESPAIYGLLAQIAKNQDDRSLYQMACEKLVSMQHLEQDPYYGGFINIQTLDAYSFDQLMALLGY